LTDDNQDNNILAPATLSGMESNLIQVQKQMLLRADGLSSRIIYLEACSDFAV